MANWHPEARRVQYSSAGPHVPGAKPRGILHTTETPTMPGTFRLMDEVMAGRASDVILMGQGHIPLHHDSLLAGAAIPLGPDRAAEARRQLSEGARWLYSGSAPLFTIDPRDGELQQHMPANLAQKALLHPPGTVETNRQGARQIEQIGYASQTQDWPGRYYDVVGELGRWVEENCGVKRGCSVRMVGNGNINHMSVAKWIDYDEWAAHQHVVNNFHWDCGLYDMDQFLDLRADVHRTLNLGESGADVEAFQRAINRVANNCNIAHRVAVDGVFGKQTREDGAWAVYMMGVGRNTDEIKDGGITPYSQRHLRVGVDSLNENELERRRARRVAHCN